MGAIQGHSYAWYINCMENCPGKTPKTLRELAEVNCLSTLHFAYPKNLYAPQDGSSLLSIFEREFEIEACKKSNFFSKHQERQPVPLYGPRASKPPAGGAANWLL